MKNISIKFLSLFFLSILLISCSDSDDDKFITKEELPTNSITFIDNHFANFTINYVKQDDSEYEVKFTNGLEIDFYINGDWKEVDGNNQAIPTTFIHKNILSYIGENYSSLSIIKIEKKAINQKVKLSKRLELIFNSQGNLI